MVSAQAGNGRDVGSISGVRAQFSSFPWEYNHPTTVKLVPCAKFNHAYLINGQPMCFSAKDMSLSKTHLTTINFLILMRCVSVLKTWPCSKTHLTTIKLSIPSTWYAVGSLLSADKGDYRGRLHVPYGGIYEAIIYHILLKSSFPKRVKCQSKNLGCRGNVKLGNHVLEKTSS